MSDRKPNSENRTTTTAKPQDTPCYVLTLKLTRADPSDAPRLLPGILRRLLRAYGMKRMRIK